MITKIIIGLVLTLSLVNTQTERCYNDCFVSSNCQQNELCISQLFFCDNACESYEDSSLELQCIRECTNVNYPGEKLSPQLTEFLKCQKACINGDEQHIKKAYYETKKPSSQKSQPLTVKQKLRQKFLKDPASHTGETLVDIDCDDIETKKKVYILKGNTHKMIIDYFKSRCDFAILPDSKKDSPVFDFKWCDYHFQHNWDKFKEGKQIVNHVQNLKDLISFKDAIVRTYRDFDKKQIYNFDSTDFHFETHLFDLESTSINKEEQHFFDNVNSGLWITKDPDGSLGLGIQLFKDVGVIKKEIKKLKNTPNKTYDKQTRLQQYSVIQKYLENPLLWNKKKIDFRGYTLIASLDPFVVLYQPGFLRKCIEDYDVDFKSWNQKEAYKHLTNRIYQKSHPKYQQLAESLMIKYSDFLNFLEEEHNFTQEDFDKFEVQNQRTVAYTMMAAKDKFIKQKGVFQLMGFDLMWDENYKTYLIEFNTSAGLYTTTQVHKTIIPQLVQSSLDLVLETLESQENIVNKWQNPQDLELGRWQIIINEAAGYNILDQYKKESTSKQQSETKKSDL